MKKDIDISTISVLTVILKFDYGINASRTTFW